MMKANLRFIDTLNRMISLQIFVMNIVKTSIMPVIVKIAPPPIVNLRSGAPFSAPCAANFGKIKKWPPTATECFSSF